MALFAGQTVEPKRASFGRLSRTEQAARTRDAALFEAVGIAGLSIDLTDDTTRFFTKPSVQAAAGQFSDRIETVLRNQRIAPLSKNGIDLLVKTNDWMKRVKASDDPGAAMMGFRRDVRFDALAVSHEILRGNEVAPAVKLPSDEHQAMLDKAQFTLSNLP